MADQKRALVVDDSRTAREALARVLRRHGIAVETAESAEAALDMLGAVRPDVIFMDHLMPGMDGFEAVRAIKQKPATATIPIMMYTSQAGELYVGQARALGAVGVLPKQIRPIQVSEMLASLNLLPVAGEQPAAVADEHATPAAVEESLASVFDVMEPADWADLHRWFERMLEHHGETLRADIESSVERAMHKAAAHPGAPGRPTGRNGSPGAGLRRINAASLLVVVLALFSAAIFWMYLGTQRDWRAVYEQNVALLDVLNQKRGTVRVAEQRAALPPQRPQAITTGLRELESAANRFASYGADDIPLDDRRLELLEGLVDRLRTIGFTGEIQVDSHVGDFCYVRGTDGRLESAPADTPVDGCDRVGLAPADARARSAKESVAFANYVAAFGRGGDADIRIRINALGNSSPLFSYPARSAAHTAGEWNAVARQNNRVQVRLIAANDAPDGSAGPLQ